ncbi:hypothetical protein SXCC_04397 [Gluconacetobacter sp. SXCC-1]|nr:hypothetical protein SXCC_04397 [Gluconacetobacter sp. SXCC-1]
MPPHGGWHGGMVVNFIAIRYGLVYEMAATGSPVVGFRT